ncbi:MAG: mycofactocin precursor [Desulfobacteraceae bacterium]|uniref:Mycofactocin n=1 Tax=Candidatus Desulfacyla euxinica TaxID=2841693 RepID=A0A8J6N0W2_9DELT|nr:mycofactocin precursor [Candidatus Desulfacyla euxinica]MBL6977459.1 mycofactocin precursor [Desulfobacteraceae bacterium]MBL7218215.1 mycofactocin precursor [Desulfobacteraceae bacterium]
MIIEEMAIDGICGVY